MYQITYANEQPLHIDLNEVKQFIGISSDEENELIAKFIDAATNLAEAFTNNAFRAKDVSIYTSSDVVYLIGVIDESKPITVTYAEDGVNAPYKRVNNRLRIDNEGGAVVIAYSTKEHLPAEVKIFVYQEVAKMYQRGTEIISEPDTALLSRHKMLGIC
jgi:hypothetical protein